MGLAKLNSLYRQVVLDYGQHPHHFGELETANYQATLRNPSCGDEIKVAMEITDHQIKAIRFSGKGCTISMASTSMLTDLLQGQDVSVATNVISAFKRQLTVEKPDPAEQAQLGDAWLLRSVREFPTRVRCATLGWHVAESILQTAQD
ncbi:SUF system NifU family Fe-S cluster assembly protein [Fructilactobacillus hinvesii]|uniref:SUF system NifU family Fe-S cluster assembly protein n=1 Tax=Fructilactobacillus hinvesii TaxID=2940300 RepID=A0ABY5BU33_9LACO|nr:SUF system NifU family Fe-S cluster assembly protein [Fructilactobacillus hinvesii]USS88160.1 SUF system NifU family Fe-S cluster assembly protein [Fructilactobacillus hinvesii]